MRFVDLRAQNGIGQCGYRSLITYVLLLAIMVLAAAYITRGYRNALLLPDGSGDLKLRYYEQQYIHQGINPNHVYEFLRGYSGATPVEVDPTIHLSPDASGYPPWAYFTALLLIPFTSWPLTKVFFALINTLSLGIMARFVYKVTVPYGRVPAIWLMVSVLAMGSNSFALGVGQYGLLINGMLAAMALCLNTERWASAGVLYGLSLIKPSISPPFFFILLVRQRWSAIAAATLYIGAASLAMWGITKTDPVTMFMQMLDARRAGGSTMWRVNWPLDIARLLGVSESIILIITAATGLVLSCLVMWVYRNSDIVILLGIASVFGYIWTVHFPYDQVMLAFLLVAIGHLVLKEPTRPNVALFAVVATSLWIPPRASMIVYVEYTQMLIWLFALGVLLFKERLSTKEKEATVCAN